MTATVPLSCVPFVEQSQAQGVSHEVRLLICGGPAACRVWDAVPRAGASGAIASEIPSPRLADKSNALHLPVALDRRADLPGSRRHQQRRGGRQPVPFHLCRDIGRAAHVLVGEGRAATHQRRGYRVDEPVGEIGDRGVVTQFEIERCLMRSARPAAPCSRCLASRSRARCQVFFASWAATTTTPSRSPTITSPV